jgi:signal transduction histidine kinase
MGEFMEQLTNDLHFSAQKKNLGVDFMIGNSSIIDASTVDASTPVNIGGEHVVRPLYYTYIDPDRVREVITNLFDNACKYSDKGKISLGLTGNDAVVQLYVRDQGHGIPPEDLPHLFQKFYRVDNSATRTIGGTGLGLFISRKIIELYSGRIWVESVLAKGSTFYINLPRLSTQQAEQMRAEQIASAAQELAPGGTTTDQTTAAAPSVPTENAA